MLCVGITDLIDVLAAGANSRAVPLLSFRIIAVHLDQHGIINALTKAIWHCRQVRLKRKPDTMGETARKILNDLRGASWILRAVSPIVSGKEEESRRCCSR